MMPKPCAVTALRIFEAATTAQSMLVAWRRADQPESPYLWREIVESIAAQPEPVR